MYDINQDLDYFTREEFACQYTGENEISDRLLLKLDLLRARCGFPLLSPVVIVQKTTPLKQRRRKQELMPKVLQRTLKSTAVCSGLRLLRRLSRWAFQELELLVALSMLTSATLTVMSLL